MFRDPSARSENERTNPEVMGLLVSRAEREQAA
jgi:hypothetical protein